MSTNRRSQLARAAFTGTPAAGQGMHLDGRVRPLEADADWLAQQRLRPRNMGDPTAGICFKCKTLR